jgi:UDP-glucose 4-epimerase
MPIISGKKVLVTGGAGFIGSHLTDALLEKGAEKVVVVDNFFLGKMENLENAVNNENFVLYRDDARHLGVMKSIIKHENIDIVFNLATIALNYSFFNPLDAYMVNVQIAETLLNLLQDGAYKTLIHSSSSEAFGTALYSPMDENHPMNPTTPYAAGKAAADLMVLSFQKVLHLDIAVIRPFNNYGPRQNTEGPLAGIIPGTAARILAGEAPYIEGTGEQTRDFIYVTDTVRAFILAYECSDSRGQVINLGSGKEISMNKLVEIIANYLGYNGEIIRKPSRASDVKRLCASSELAKKLLGFTPEIDFDEGIKKTLDWYMEHRAKV